MQDKALKFEKLRGAERMLEIGAGTTAASNVGAIETLREAVAAQRQRPAGDALSSSVPPMITDSFMELYCAAKAAALLGAMSGGADWGVAILHA